MIKMNLRGINHDFYFHAVVQKDGRVRVRAYQSHNGRKLGEGSGSLVDEVQEYVKYWDYRSEIDERKEEVINCEICDKESYAFEEFMEFAKQKEAVVMMYRGEGYWEGYYPRQSFLV